MKEVAVVQTNSIGTPGFPEKDARQQADMLASAGAFLAVSILRVVFTYALLFDQQLLRDAWDAFRGLPLVPEGVMGALLLPWVAGLWIWDAAWPQALRLALIGGIAITSLYLFFQPVRK